MSDSREPRRHRSQPRRGLRREEAATYVGVSLRKFQDMVRDGDMPQPKLIGDLPVFDIDLLDRYFEALPDKPPEKPIQWGHRDLRRHDDKRR